MTTAAMGAVTVYNGARELVKGGEVGHANAVLSASKHG